MSGWRDSASAQSQADLDGLVNAALPFATKLLDERGEFFPFGVVVTTEGATELFGADPGLGERPPSSEVQAHIVEGFRLSRDRLRATAACADVRLPDTDAVMVAVEHLEGPVLTVFLPYQKKRFGRSIQYGDLRASAGQRQVWAEA